jgi:hypothetical protein
MICGNRTLPWEDFSAVILWLIQHDTLHTLHPSGLSPFPSTLQCVLTLVAWRYAKLEEGSVSRDLESMLLETRNFKATEVRDKIFALLGMAEDVDETSISTDYTATVQELFIETARQLLTLCKSTLLLTAAGIGYERPLQNLPSWTPDWASTSEDYSLNSAECGGFAATNERNPKIKIWIRWDSDLLAIDAILLDSIIAVHEPRHPPRG